MFPLVFCIDIYLLCRWVPIAWLYWWHYTILDTAWKCYRIAHVGTKANDWSSNVLPLSLLWLDTKNLFLIQVIHVVVTLASSGGLWNYYLVHQSNELILCYKVRGRSQNNRIIRINVKDNNPLFPIFFMSHWSAIDHDMTVATYPYFDATHGEKIPTPQRLLFFLLEFVDFCSWAARGSMPRHVLAPRPWRLGLPPLLSGRLFSFSWENIVVCFWSPKKCKPIHGSLSTKGDCVRIWLLHAKKTHRHIPITPIVLYVFLVAFRR